MALTKETGPVRAFDDIAALRSEHRRLQLSWVLNSTDNLLRDARRGFEREGGEPSQTTQSVCLIVLRQPRRGAGTTQTLIRFQRMAMSGTGIGTCERTDKTLCFRRSRFR
ncbi:hypothetical protein AAFF_G00422990 [Aldrovandia affinis]|uniref:Uncharacterized protein n=1 Tax=Aldrovandia affinis TaxID=143900 RepID=A0AAD7X0V8_9TELE|nr:hypothetical protein AAFF_G00422990 [Aldrovandia affinis]